MPESICVEISSPIIPVNVEFTYGTFVLLII
jgi:hypothetical protein